MSEAIDATGLKWKSEDELNAELEETKKTRDVKKYGKDGFIVAAEGEFSHRGIKYLVKVLRYFTFTATGGWIPMSDRSSVHHCVVEYPEETKPLAHLLERLEFGSDFLYHDTLHSFADNMDVNMQAAKCHEMAKQDIEEIPEKIAALEKDVQSLKDFVESATKEDES